MDQDRGFHGGTTDSAVNGGERLLVKLKLPVLGAVAAASSSSPRSSGERASSSHRCCICGKDFSSGKALGGHMRVHYQSKNNRPVRSCPATDPGESDDRKHKCKICSREFFSKKALYGHMRSHPSRTARGMRTKTPKTTEPSSSSSSFMVADRQIIDSGSSSCAAAGGGGSNGVRVVDCSKNMSFWSNTARRGRKNIASSSTPAATSSVGFGPEKQIRGPVFLAKAETSATSSGDLIGKKRKIEELFKAIDGGSDHVGSSKLQTDGEKKTAFYDRKLSPDIQTSDEESTGGLGRKKEIKVKKIKEIGKLNFPDKETPEDHVGGHGTHLENPIPTNKHRCNICEKAFPSHQALGGHKSSHYKPKKTLPEPLPPSSELESATSEDGGCTHRATPPTEETGTSHQIFNVTIFAYKVCGAVGTTDAQTSQVASSLGETSQTERRTLDFDLNELPSMEEGEGNESGSPHHQQPNK